MKAIWLVIGIAIVIALVFAFSQNKGQNKSGSESQPPVLMQEASFAIPAGTVGYFYTEYCHWCQQEKPILEELEKSDYKFTRIDISQKKDWAEHYKITGTPTFITPSGNRQEGFLEREALKSWIEKNL